MLNYKQALLAYLLRLPFFLVVYTLIVLISHDLSAGLLLSLLVVYTLVFIVDTLVTERSAFLVVCVALCVIFAVLRMPRFIVIAICSVLYRPVSYSNQGTLIWVICLLALTLFSEFIEPALSFFCARNMILAAVFSVSSRLIGELELFLGSYYNSQVSRKMASAVVIRSCRLSLTMLAGIVIVGFIAARPIYPTSDMRLPLSDFIFDFSDFVYPESVYPQIEPGAGTNIPDDPEPENTDLDALGLAVQNITMIIMYAMIPLLVLILIFYLLYTFRRRSGSKLDDFDEIVEEAPAVLDPKAKSRRKWLVLGINQTVRRMFRSKVRRHMGVHGLYPQKSDTPKKLAVNIRQWEDIDSLQRLYDKARYSNESVTRSELSALNARRNR